VVDATADSAPLDFSAIYEYVYAQGRGGAGGGGGGEAGA
jgi:hypothetical protein